MVDDPNGMIIRICAACNRLQYLAATCDARHAEKHGIRWTRLLGDLTSAIEDLEEYQNEQ